MLPPFDAWHSATVACDVALVPQAGAAALAERQQRRLADLLAAAAASPLYAPLLRGRDPARVRLQELPVMRKPALMARFDDWATDRALTLRALRRFVADPSRIAEPFLDKYLVWESSGSSGVPCVFVQDGAAMAVYDALEALRRPARSLLQEWLDPCLLEERIAFLGATGGHFASTVSMQRLRRLNPALAQRIHGVSFLQPLPHLLAQLQALSPTVVATYPSAAVVLAGEQRAGRLQLALRELWTGGETLTPAMRRHVQEAFGCPVVNSYGASEFLSLAWECGHGLLHLNADWALLEAVDAHGRAVPAGCPGTTTLLTNLANHVQPVIRYDLGDRVTFATMPCACGSCLPVIDVQGRCDDTLHLGTAGVPVLPLAISTVLEDDAGLFDFQLVQRGPCDLRLQTRLRGAAVQRTMRQARDALAAFLAGQGAAPVRITCRTGEAGRPGRSGKLQRIVAPQSSHGRGRTAAKALRTAATAAL